MALFFLPHREKKKSWKTGDRMGKKNPFPPPKFYFKVNKEKIPEDWEREFFTQKPQENFGKIV